MKIKTLYFDTETTSLEEDRRMVEIAFKHGRSEIESFRVYPEEEITIGAMAVHHITNEDVAQLLPFESHPSYFKLKKYFSDPDVVAIAHNAKFDIEVLGNEGIEVGRYICTYRLALFLDQEGEYEQHTLQYLRYAMNLDCGKTGPAHSAHSDVVVLRQLFIALAWEYSQRYECDPESLISDIIEISTKPALLPRLTFGKHRGTLYSEAPKSYLRWMAGQEFDENVLYTVKHYLEV